MGQTFLRVDATGALPALGLVHTAEPGSVMCCTQGGIDFNDPAQRQAYVAGRRTPDLRSIERQLADHYARFWKRSP